MFSHRNRLFQHPLQPCRKDSHREAATGWSEGGAEATNLLSLLFAWTPNETLGLQADSSKNPANSHVKPRTPENPHRKTNKQSKMKHLQAQK
jgi:hypothetical protein